MSAEVLARAVTRLGMPYTRAQVTTLETGRRASVSVGELMAFGAALCVPPALLVCPLGSDEKVELLPSHTETPWMAYLAFTGQAVLTSQSGDPETLFMREAPEIIDAYRRHQRAVEGYVRTNDRQDRNRLAALDLLIAVRKEFRARGWEIPTSVRIEWRTEDGTRYLSPEDEAEALRDRLDQEAAG